MLLLIQLFYHFVYYGVLQAVFLCLCCASGLITLNTIMAFVERLRHATIVSPFVSCDSVQKNIRQSRDILYMSISNYRLSYLMCTAYCFSMSLCYSKI